MFLVDLHFVCCLDVIFRSKSSCTVGEVNNLFALISRGGGQRGQCLKCKIKGGGTLHSGLGP